MSEKQPLSVLITPFGQLSGDGQLRESFHERRDRKGQDYPMWYLTPELVRKFELSSDLNQEAVVAEDASVIAWLKLRFGGERSVLDFDIDSLREIASNPPPLPERRDISIKRPRD